MQLFTIGVVDLNLDGTPKTDASGKAIESYTNDDVTGLAKVFTGLSLPADAFNRGITKVDTNVRKQPMKMWDDFHSPSEKRFLGTTIPANTRGEESVDLALDALFEHPNVGPFIGRQMIQRLVMSDPSPSYVERVATAFNSGRYTLPSGARVGTGQRGDMKAMIAAVLMDVEALSESTQTSARFGKLREPVLRLTHWARAFDAGTVTPQNTRELWNTGESDSLSQGPYKAPSVFNYYRPGYVAPGSETGNAGMTVPELQITNASTMVAYSNFLSRFVFGSARDTNNFPKAGSSFKPDYGREKALATNPDALIRHLDLVLAAGQLTSRTTADIKEAISAIPLNKASNASYDGADLRVKVAIMMVMTSPDYLVQR